MDVPKIRTREIYWHNNEKPSLLLAEDSFANREKIWLYNSPLGQVSVKTLKVLFPVLFAGNTAGIETFKILNETSF